MFRPAAVYIGLRYNRAKRRNAFISFIAMTSMIGIALGVLVLITVLSVMNGFDEQIKQRVFSMANHLTVTKYGGLENWPQLGKFLAQYPEVKAVAPFVAGQGMLSAHGRVQAAYITGIDPSLEKNISALADKMEIGQLSNLTTKRFGIVIGEGLANALGLTLGDDVIVVTPEWSVSIAGVMPVLKRFTVVGVFRVGNGFGFDNQLSFINLKDAQALYHLSASVTGIRLKLDDLYKAPRLSEKIKKDLPYQYEVSDWTEKFGSLFAAISMEKTMMFLILGLIIGVAAFNLVATLVMVVTDKQADIAILRTFGATPGIIMTIFIVQGSVIGMVGTLLGLLGGVLLATHVTSLFDILQQTFHLELMSSKVYYVNYLPSKLQWHDVWQVCSISFILSMLATLYPAWRASRVQPAEALRYE